MRPAQIPLDWPLSDASEMVQAGGVAFHVQRLGTGPRLLMVHGTAASTHSFRVLATGLCDRFEVILVDLPGHGFSGPLQAPTLPRMAAAIGALMGAMGKGPDMIIGHSAGAAIALRMVLDDWAQPKRIIGLAPALKPFGGAADGFASQLARLAFVNPLAPRLVSASATRDRVVRLIGKTGSSLDPAGSELYARLLRRSSHVKGALSMMAHWNLRPLLADLKDVRIPLNFIVGEKDRATLPRDVRHAASLVPSCDYVELPVLGHLAHEENPAAIAPLILNAARKAGLLEKEAATAPRLATAR